LTWRGRESLDHELVDHGLVDHGLVNHGLVDHELGALGALGAGALPSFFLSLVVA